MEQKVYVVSRSEYTDFDIMGIFGTEKEANDFAEELDRGKEHYNEYYDVSEWALGEKTTDDYTY